MSETDASVALYGLDDDDQKASSPAAMVEKDAAEILYPEEAREDREAAMADQDAQQHDDDGEHEVADLVEALGLDTENPITEDFVDTIGELGIDQAGAEKLADLELKNRSSYWDKQSDAWIDDLKSEGEETFNTMTRNARSVVDQFGDKDMKKLVSGPYGNCAPMIRMLNRIARQYDVGN